MLPRFKVVINPFNRTNKKGEYSIMIRVTLGKQVKYFNTRIKIMLQYWRDKEPEWIKENHPQSRFLNAIIKQKKDLLYEHACRLHFLRKPVTMDGIVEFYRKKGDPHSFIDFVAHQVYHNQEYKKNYNTWKKYKTFHGLIAEYNPHLQIGQLEENEFNRYITWRRENYDVSDETISKDLDCFKKLTKEAIKQGYLDRNPFEFVKLSLKKSTRRKADALDVDEIRKISGLDLTGSPELIRIRELFMFCVYSCMYYSNLLSLEWGDIIDGPNGPCIEAYRTKNNLPFVAPIYIYPNAMKILKQQKGKNPVKVFPGEVTEPYFNRKLKDLAKLAGIDKKISNKFARKTGATFLSSLGLETHFVKKIMGHTKESTTHEYLYIAAKEVSNRINRMDLNQVDF